MRRLLALTVASWVLAGAGAAAGPRLEARAVFGAWRPGDTLAVRVDVENPGPAGRYELRVRPIYAPHVQHETVETVELAAGARKSVWLLAHPTDQHLIVELLDGERVASFAPLSTELVAHRLPFGAVLGNVPAGLHRALGGTTHRPGTIEWREVRLDELPPEERLWPELDFVAWPAPRAHELEPRPAEALRRFVANGGLLIAGRSAEDPEALTKLGLWAPGSVGPRSRLGLGLVHRVEADLSRRPAEAWAALLMPEKEPPTARVDGPRQLLSEVQGRVAGAVEAPVASATIVVLGVLAGLAGVSLARRRRIAGGRSLPRRAWAPGALVVAVGTAAALLVAGGGVDGGLALVRLDVVDVDLSTGPLRSESFIGLRRAASGRVEIDTRGAGRLTSPPDPTATRPPSELDRPLTSDLPSSRLEARVGSYETLLLRARWSVDALSLPPLPAGAEELLAALGADAGQLASRGRWTRLGSPAGSGPSDMEKAGAAARWLGGNWGLGVSEKPSSLTETARSLAEARQQWRWPAHLRWRGVEEDELLVTVTEGAAGPPLFVDGRLARPVEAYTLWRIRLAGGGAS